MTAPFRITSAFQVEELAGESRGGRQLVRLIAPIEYHVGSADSGQIIVVPAGFKTDFASIPWGFRNLFPPIGKYSRAAVIHDFLYRVRGEAPEAAWHLREELTREQAEALEALRLDRPTINARRYSRREADDVFREAMSVLGVDPIRRNIMHRAVRTFGAGGWGK